ncbi:uncharacterized protein LOC291558 isoform X1 [Rattus norvegicus]|uniref:uncharacterized protein LOC291558 isoform X1 n=1 Tax=Rattus norvegicus TaxID=10116 RepID=UPI0003D0DF4C|nr:uncharacterized protein LOC291558 isoform X2 [Rattus norvegicus]|eukprot:XP_008770345.1 PREDICTED: uncharacterized protein LOC291558 isoform X2 [Rattus norvegicus]
MSGDVVHRSTLLSFWSTCCQLFFPIASSRTWTTKITLLLGITFPCCRAESSKPFWESTSPMNCSCLRSSGTKIVTRTKKYPPYQTHHPFLESLVMKTRPARLCDYTITRADACSGWLNTGRRKLKLKRRAKSLELLSLKKRKIYQGFSDVLLGLGNLKQQTNKQTTNK